MPCLQAATEKMGPGYGRKGCLIMPVTEDEVDDALYAEGVKSTRTRIKLLRLINLYAAGCAGRKLSAGIVPFLFPGESDPEAGITCCRGCGTVKGWTMFPPLRGGATGSASTAEGNGYDVTCLECRQSLRGDPDLVLTCRECGEEGRAGDRFTARKNTPNGWGRTCKDCLRRRKEVPGEAVTAGL
jgi:hypothetical protein